MRNRINKSLLKRLIARLTRLEYINIGIIVLIFKKTTES